jgi:hypothetical protein
MMHAADLYETDFYAWTRRQARAIRDLARSRWNGPLDLEHLAGEIEDLGREQRNTVRSWLLQIMIHLLLLQLSRAKEPRAGWMDEVDAARDSIEARLSATLRRDLTRSFDALYAKARRRVAARLDRYGEPERCDRLPERAPFTLDQALGEGWYPDRIAE